MQRHDGVGIAVPNADWELNVLESESRRPGPDRVIVNYSSRPAASGLQKYLAYRLPGRRAPVDFQIRRGAVLVEATREPLRGSAGLLGRQPDRKTSKRSGPPGTRA